MGSLVVKSPAKLNLYLNVLEKRNDGYHEIETIFERIDLCDEIKFSENENGKIELFSNCPEIPLDRDSLVYNCVELLRKELEFPKGITVSINKCIPIASGLGGGSSNAASIILGLNRFWGLNLALDKLLNIGRMLGSDVCFFLHNQPLGIGRGRGDEIVPLPRPKRAFSHILVVPEERISSRQAYSKKAREDLTKQNFGIKIITYALKKGDLALLGEGLYNSLEEGVVRSYPVIEEIKKVLASLGLTATLMSGSGPAVFGLTATRKEAMRLKKEIDSKHPEWKTFVVTTY